MAGGLRVQARVSEIVAIIERDGHAAAALHGATPPTDYEGAGDRQVTNVPLPEGAIDVTPTGSHTGSFAVQAVRWRSEGWAAKVHRAVQIAGPHRFSEVIAASLWALGAWGGDSLLSADWRAFGLPPEANPS